MVRLSGPALGVLTASPLATLSTTVKGTCSKCVWGFRLTRLVLLMEKQ
jgi:hypothetical protein